MLNILISFVGTLICCGAMSLYTWRKVQKWKDMILEESAKHDFRNRADFGYVIEKLSEAEANILTGVKIVSEQQTHMLEKLDDTLDTATAADPRELVAQGISAMLAYDGQPRKRGE